MLALFTDAAKRFAGDAEVGGEVLYGYLPNKLGVVQAQLLVAFGGGVVEQAKEMVLGSDGNLLAQLSAQPLDAGVLIVKLFEIGAHDDEEIHVLHGLDVYLRLLLGDEAGVGRDHVGGEVEVAGDFLAQVVEVVEPKVAGGEEGKLVGNLSGLD